MGISGWAKAPPEGGKPSSGLLYSGRRSESDKVANRDDGRNRPGQCGAGIQ